MSTVAGNSGPGALAAEKTGPDPEWIIQMHPFNHSGCAHIEPHPSKGPKRSGSLTKYLDLVKGARQSHVPIYPIDNGLSHTR